MPSSAQRQGGISSGPAKEGATHFSVAPGQAWGATQIEKSKEKARGPISLPSFAPAIARESVRGWTAALTICIRLGFKLSASLEGENLFSPAVPSTRRVSAVSSQWAERARRATRLLSTWALGPSSIRHP